MSHDPANADPPADPTADPAALEELLVAYLDEELDDDQTGRVEALLAADPRVRETLKRLEQTWDLLDELDRSALDETFTRTTLEMVAVAAADDVLKQEEEAPRRRRRRWLIGSACVLTAGLAGSLAVGLFRSNPNDQLLRDLPVLENLDEYDKIDDVEFLRMLYREELFAKEAPDDS